MGMGIHTALCGGIEIDSDKINTIGWVGGKGGKLQVKRWGKGIWGKMMIGVTGRKHKNYNNESNDDDYGNTIQSHEIDPAEKGWWDGLAEMGWGVVQVNDE
jgi:hypothetical protein